MVGPQPAIYLALAFDIVPLTGGCLFNEPQYFGFTTTTAFNVLGSDGQLMVPAKTPLIAGNEYALEVIGFDNTGWAIATSTDQNQSIGFKNGIVE